MIRIGWKHGDMGALESFVLRLLRLKERKDQMSSPGQPQLDNLLMFEALPPDWTVFLDPCSFLQLHSANKSVCLSNRKVEMYWSGLCRSHLERLINSDGSYTIEICFDIDAKRQVRQQHQQPAGSADVERQLPSTLSVQRCWKHVFRDLVGDTSQLGHETPGTRGLSAKQDTVAKEGSEEADHSSGLRPGSLLAAAGNELRNSLDDFRFPVLPEARATPEIHTANLLHEVGITKDDLGRFTCCHLRSPLGGDRCVMAKYPLPWQGAATAFPVEPRPRLPGLWKWQVARLPCAYYELEIQSPTARTPPTRDLPGEHCVSIGLALATISLRGLCRQQAGWNPHSWALHGDDGQIYHGHGQGVRFEPLWTSCSQPGKAPDADGVRDTEAAVTGKRGYDRRIPRFSVGDVVGCGVCKLDAPGHFGIFFSLNGELLGVCFPVFSAVEPRFYPCVGIDTPFDISFNFGSKPFCLDLNALHGLRHARHPHYAAARCVDVSTRVMEFPIAHWPGTRVTPEEEEISIDSASSEASGDTNTSREHRYQECSPSQSESLSPSLEAAGGL